MLTAAPDVLLLCCCYADIQASDRTAEQDVPYRRKHRLLPHGLALRQIVDLMYRVMQCALAAEP
jgi:hypothetical protein